MNIYLKLFIKNFIIIIFIVSISYIIPNHALALQPYPVDKVETIEQDGTKFLRWHISNRRYMLKSIPAEQLKKEDLINTRKIASENIAKVEVDIKPNPFSINPGSISLLTDFYSSKIEAQDISNKTKATLLSKSNFAYHIIYNQKWSDKLQTDLFFSQRKIDFYAPSTGGVLLNTKLSLYSFGIGLNFLSSEKSKFRFWLTNESVPFFRGISLTEVTVEPLSLFAFGTSYTFKYLINRDLSLESTLGAMVYAPKKSGSFETELNNSFHVTVSTRQHVSQRLELEAGLLANRKGQKTTIVDQSQTDFGIFLKLIVPFGNENKF